MKTLFKNKTDRIDVQNVKIPLTNKPKTNLNLTYVSTVV